MSTVGHVAARIARLSHGRDRLVVAIAGPPAAGKSTLAAALRDALDAGGEQVAVVPMDGFHFDDGILEARGLRPRKGAPETFDVAGLRHLLDRIRQGETDTAYPVFDRSLELARAGAGIVEARTRIVLVEGNYLLLDEDPWRGLVAAFDATIYLDVAPDELERRLMRRWLEFGHGEQAARDKVMGNDLPNAMRVARARLPADIVL